MKKISLLGLLVALFAMFTGVASAEGHSPVLTADPGSVDAAGEHTFTVSGEDFTPGNSIFVLPCAGAEGSLEAMAEGDATALCDIGNLTPAVIGDDGTFSVEVTYDVPEIGLVVSGGDAGGVDGAATLVTVGAAQAEEAPAEEAAEEAPAADADLAQTGVETPVMVGLGTMLLGAGFVATRAGRRLGDR